MAFRSIQTTVASLDSTARQNRIPCLRTNLPNYQSFPLHADLTHVSPQDILALFAWSVIKPLTHDGLTNYWDTQALINIHGGLFKTCPAEGKMDLQRNKMIHSVFPPPSRTVSIKTASMSLMIHTDAQYLSDQWMGHFLLLVWPVNRAENTDNRRFL